MDRPDHPKKKIGRPKGAKDLKQRRRQSFGPYNLDKATAKLFLENIRIGCPFPMAAGEAGVSVTSVYAWIRNGKKEDAPADLKRFRAAYLKAKHHAGKQDVKTLWKAAKKGNIVAAQWRLAHRYPEQFGTRAKVELTGANGGPIETRVSHLSDKELADRLTRAMKIAEEVTAREGAPKVRHGIEVSPPPTAAEVQAAGPSPGVQVVQEPPKAAGAPAAPPTAPSTAQEGNMPPKAPVVLSPKDGAK